jgi:putative DNA primase/helicase
MEEPISQNVIEYLKSKSFKQLTSSEMDILNKEAPGFLTEEMAYKFMNNIDNENPEEETGPETQLEIEYKNFRILFSSDAKETSYEIAKYLVGKYHVKTVGEKIREVFIYKAGVYISGLNTLRSEIQAILQEQASTHYKNNIIEMVKDFTVTNREDFHVNENLINLNNGIFNIKNAELIPHSPEYLFFTKIPVNYDPGAKCPTIELFLKDILPPEHIEIILEWFGYCLYRRYFIKKAVIFVGERDTGKSTLIKLYMSFIGDDNTSGVSLQKLGSDKFASSQLYNKHINVYDDLDFKDINNNGLFKIATGGGVMSGERKFAEQFQFLNYAKLTFACNKVPDVKDTNDDAYFSRWIVVPFLAEIEKKDKSLTGKITTPEELSGLLNLAILGLKKIIENQDFSYDKNPEEIKKEMLLSGSMIAKFVEDRLEEEVNGWVSKDDMYNECANYALQEKLPAISKQFLGRKLPSHSGYIIDGTKLIGTKQEQGWRNVRIKGKSDLFQDG